MTEQSARFALPLLVAGQGQKDIVHNEALTILDAIIHPVVQSMHADMPATPVVGHCWLVPFAAAGDWIGKDGDIAIWTAGGWRFSNLPMSTRVWVISENGFAYRGVHGWKLEKAAERIEAPIGGSVIDIEGRAATAAIIERLTQLGISMT